MVMRNETFVGGINATASVHELGLQPFFERAIVESHETPRAQRQIAGPLQPVFKQVLESLQNDVTDFDPRLTPGCLFPAAYRSPESDEIVSEVCKDTGLYEFEQFQYAYVTKKAEAIRKVIRPEIERLASHKVPWHLLDIPKYRPMFDPLSCASKAFLMVMDDIAGQLIEELPLVHALDKSYGTRHVGDEVFLGIMQSDAFQERFGVTTEAISFTGIDLGIIAKLAAGIRAGNQNRRVYAVLNVLSNTSENTADSGIWHNIVLLGANERMVTVHEPRMFNGVSGKGDMIEKDTFIDRWSQAYMRGHLIIAEPTQRKGN